ncbi:MAG TPA: benzoate-CoA ligase family protein, partial [Archangium sp.]
MNPFALPERLNLAEVFLHAQAKKHPDRPAIYFEDQVISYGALADATNRATALYKGLGLEWEQRVLLMLPDVPQFASAWFATVQAGGTVSAVNPQLKPDEVTYYLNYTRAKVVVTDAPTAAIIDSVRAQCPHLKHVLVAGGNAGKHLDYDAELMRVKPDSSIADTHKDDTCVWLYTSGSTGFPKGAVHKQHDFVFNALTYGLPILGYGEKDIGVSVPRLAFGYALGTNLLFPLLAGGATALFADKPTPEKFFQMLKKHRPTVLTAVPTALNGILNAEGIKDADFSSLRVAISAGEALPAELYQRWKQRTGVEILDGIGSAEMFHIFITNRLGDVKLGSLGRVVEGYEAKVCDDQGRELPRGDIGTLWVRGDSMALEYWQQHEKSKTTFRGDWCVSADKFQQTEDGSFYFCGRGDDMLKVSGKWLSPVEVENVLLQHPAVREAAVVAFKDADGLDKPRAFVALHDGHEKNESLAESIKAHVREKLEPYKAPRQVKFLDA